MFGREKKLQNKNKKWILILGGLIIYGMPDKLLLKVVFMKKLFGKQDDTYCSMFKICWSLEAFINDQRNCQNHDRTFILLLSNAFRQFAYKLAEQRQVSWPVK